MPNSPQSRKDMRAFAAEQDLHMLVEASKIKRDRGRYDAALARHKQLSADLAADGFKGTLGNSTAKATAGQPGGATGNKAKNPVRKQMPADAEKTGKY